MRCAQSGAEALRRRVPTRHPGPHQNSSQPLPGEDWEGASRQRREVEHDFCFPLTHYRKTNIAHILSSNSCEDFMCSRQKVENVGFVAHWMLCSQDNYLKSIHPVNKPFKEIISTAGAVVFMTAMMVRRQQICEHTSVCHLSAEGEAVWREKSKAKVLRGC